MTPADLARLRELLDGVWRHLCAKERRPEAGAAITIEPHGRMSEALYVGRGPNAHGLNVVHLIEPAHQWPDVREYLIAAANAMPALLERLERAEAQAQQGFALVDARMRELSDRYALASNVCEALDQDRDGFTIELECDSPANGEPCGTCPMCRVNRAHAAWRADGRKEAPAPPAKGETE